MEEGIDNNKYYTPTVDEFHIGFEYEYQSYDKKYWSKCTISKSDVTSSNMDYCSSNGIEDAFNQIETNSVRVKYLDGEDIESLGFEFTQSIGQADLFKNKQGCLLIFWNSTGNYIELSREDGYDLNFAGDCKNKSELIKLMKQLGI